MKHVFQFDHMVGESESFKKVIQIAAKIADTDIPILIEGEAGTGKEWLAKAIHFASKRSKKDFIVIDCSEMSETILETELFGYVRGSFAGALQDKKGLLELGNEGTIYLDHIDQLKLALQSKLIKLMDENSFYKIGGVAKKDINVRFIAATGKDLKELVDQKKFREDLYYKLNVIRLLLPPLRERKEDILPLAEDVLMKFAEQHKGLKRELRKEAQALLISYPWPGNIRELIQEVQRAALLADGQKITNEGFTQLRARMKNELLQRKVPATDSLKEKKKVLIRMLEKNAIMEALKKTSGNRSHAAKLLKISRQELIRKISSHQIPL